MSHAKRAATTTAMTAADKAIIAFAFLALVVLIVGAAASGTWGTALALIGLMLGFAGVAAAVKFRDHVAGYYVGQCLTLLGMVLTGIQLFVG